MNSMIASIAVGIIDWMRPFMMSLTASARLTSSICCWKWSVKASSFSSTHLAVSASKFFSSMSIPKSCVHPSPCECPLIAQSVILNWIFKVPFSQSFIFSVSSIGVEFIANLDRFISRFPDNATKEWINWFFACHWFASIGFVAFFILSCSLVIFFFRILEIGLDSSVEPLNLRANWTDELLKTE